MPLRPTSRQIRRKAAHWTDHPGRRGRARWYVRAGRIRITAQARDRQHKERPLLLERVSRYVREVVHEARKVVWLTYRQTVTYTVVVVVAVAVLAAFMYGFDALLGLIGRGVSGAV